MASTSTPGQLHLDQIANLRDVGAFTNAISGTNKLKQGLLYRSARPDAASSADRHRLVNELQMRTVIDLRSKTEHLEQARKLQQQAQSPAAPASSGALDPSNARAATPLKIPGLTYKEISLNGSSFSMALMRQLPFSSSAKLVALMAVGYRTQAITILAQGVMAPRGLIGLAFDSLAYSNGEIREVFTVLANENAYPVVVHCTQGKDRTGLVVLLVCLLCGTDLQAMRVDYMTSQTALQGERAEKLEEIRSIGLPDAFADCDPQWVEEVTKHINTEYGGVEAYLRKCGVTNEMMQRIRQKLLQ